jgi:hypothetical protein
MIVNDGLEGKWMKTAVANVKAECKHLPDRVLGDGWSQG